MSLNKWEELSEELERRKRDRPSLVVVVEPFPDDLADDFFWDFAVVIEVYPSTRLHFFMCLFHVVV